jgi:hypothetical protein
LIVPSTKMYGNLPKLWESAENGCSGKKYGKWQKVRCRTCMVPPGVVMSQIWEVEVWKRGLGNVVWAWKDTGFAVPCKFKFPEIARIQCFYIPLNNYFIWCAIIGNILIKTEWMSCVVWSQSFKTQLDRKRAKRGYRTRGRSGSMTGWWTPSTSLLSLSLDVSLFWT